MSDNKCSQMPKTIRFSRKTAAVCVFIFVSLCVASEKTPKTTVILDPSGALVYKGWLSKEANTRLFKLYEKAKVKPQLLQIRSGGGDVHLGLDLGEWVFRHRLDVEVLDQCVSSCANYVFTAGRRKILNPDSIVAWHGGAYQSDMEQQLKALGKNGENFLKAWRLREDAFFKTVGVDGTITVYGQNAPHVVRPSGTVGFDYSLEDMTRFGLINIVEKDGPWRWRELRPEVQAQVLRVEVKP